MEAYVMNWNDSVMASVALPKNVTATSIPSISIDNDGKVNCSGNIILSDSTSITARADMFAYTLCGWEGKDSVTVGATELNGSYYIPVAYYNARCVKYSYGGITKETNQSSGSLPTYSSGTIISSDLLQIEVEATAWDFNWTDWYFVDWNINKILEIVSHEPIGQNKWKVTLRCPGVTEHDYSIKMAKY